MSEDSTLGLLDPLRYRDEWPFLDERQILSWFARANAYWSYEGEPSSEKPHAELTSGLCSNGYFDCPRLLSYPNMAEILGRQLATTLQSHGIAEVDWVVSSAYSAIIFGHEVAKALGARFENVEKDPTDPARKRMVWGKIALPAGARVLQVEELITTLGTTQEVKHAVLEGNKEDVEFLSVVGTLVLRPESLQAMREAHQIVALVEQEIWTKKPVECPLCKAGSQRCKPKTHWEQLTGTG